MRMSRRTAFLLGPALLSACAVVPRSQSMPERTSSAILSRYFRAWGRELILYVPDRLTEGFGPTPGAFRALQEMGAELVMTVDCGAAAIATS